MADGSALKLIRETREERQKENQRLKGKGRERAIKVQEKIGRFREIEGKKALFDWEPEGNSIVKCWSWGVGTRVGV